MTLDFERAEREDIPTPSKSSQYDYIDISDIISIDVSMPYADKEKRNAHYRASYAKKYEDPTFRAREAERKAKYHQDNLEERRAKIREGVARSRERAKR